MTAKRQRGFEIVSKYKDAGIELPVRKAAASAGYDLQAAEDVLLLPHAVTIVPTGLKAYMQQDEYLGLHVRSGFSIKNKISCINNQGIIDADYYNNPSNEGHMFAPLVSLSSEKVFIPKGTRICQGIFHNYFITDNDNGGSTIRTGGMGSTGK